MTKKKKKCGFEQRLTLLLTQKKKKISKIGGKFVRFRAAVTGWVGGRQRVNFRGNKQGVRDTPGQRER